MPTRPRLTPKEVAAFADVPVNVVEKAIEDHLLPVHREATISKRPRRLLDPWSVAYVAVTGHLKGRLTAAEKRAFSPLVIPFLSKREHKDSELEV